MSPSATAVHMIELSGAEALWMLEGRGLGRLVYVQHDSAVIRPARHVWEFGRLVVRAPAPAAVVPVSATYHVDEVRAATGTGWTVAASGPVQVVDDPDEAAHYRRTLPGWTHGPHDTLLYLRPKIVRGYRLVGPGA
ncbi:pyridoxamine 5'-phosphate oxidase family protein [Streptomyces caeni]|uniref:Pyridoxamine 5'-phosphate oxidase family protein n=1 Tax=Streptomyces caeni TaxID=2307231 RepID=A0ABW4J0D7_9ACTN